MDEKVFRTFAKVVGAEHLLLPVANKYDMDYPDNWDELSPDEQEAWKKEHEMKANTDDKPVVSELAKPAPKPEAVTIPQGLMQLNSLVTELGGVEAVKTLLLSAATVTANALSEEEKEREKLTAAIVANSAEKIAASDLEDVELPILRKMADAFTPRMRNVDYSALGTRQIKANSDKVAPRPHFFTAEKSQ